VSRMDPFNNKTLYMTSLMARIMKSRCVASSLTKKRQWLAAAVAGRRSWQRGQATDHNQPTSSASQQQSRTSLTYTSLTSGSVPRKQSDMDPSQQEAGQQQQPHQPRAGDDHDEEQDGTIRVKKYFDEWSRCLTATYQRDQLYRMGKFDDCTRQWNDVKLAFRAKFLVKRPDEARQLLETTYYHQRTTVSPTADVIWRIKQKPGWD